VDIDWNSIKYMVSCVYYKSIEFEEVCHVYYNVETFKNACFEVAHSLLKADLGSKEEDIIFLPFNLKMSVGKLRKNQRGKDEEDQPSMIRKRISTLKCNNYK